MVLVKSLTEEELTRHYSIIRDYAKTTMGTDRVDIEYLGNGTEKGVYRVRFDQQHFLAAATLRERNKSLLPEYNVLNELYEHAAEFFPRPIAHYRSPSSDEHQDLMIMELLPHVDIDIFRRENLLVHNLQRTLAYELGKAMFSVWHKTGRYSSEPHDGNILARMNVDAVELKFCDAIQFKSGSLDDAMRAVLINKDERPECFRFIPKFRDGVADAMVLHDNISFDQAKKRLGFLSQYNSIL